MVLIQEYNGFRHGSRDGSLDNIKEEDEDLDSASMLAFQYELMTPEQSDDEVEGFHRNVRVIQRDNSRNQHRRMSNVVTYSSENGIDKDDNLFAVIPHPTEYISEESGFSANYDSDDKSGETSSSSNDIGHHLRQSCTDYGSGDSDGMSYFCPDKTSSEKRRDEKNNMRSLKDELSERQRDNEHKEKRKMSKIHITKQRIRDDASSSTSDEDDPKVYTKLVPSHLRSKLGGDKRGKMSTFGEEIGCHSDDSGVAGSSNKSSTSDDDSLGVTLSKSFVGVANSGSKYINAITGNIISSRKSTVSFEKNVSQSDGSESESPFANSQRKFSVVSDKSESSSILCPSICSGQVNVLKGAFMNATASSPSSSLERHRRSEKCGARIKALQEVLMKQSLPFGNLSLQPANTEIPSQRSSEVKNKTSMFPQQKLDASTVSVGRKEPPVITHQMLNYMHDIPVPPPLPAPITIQTSKLSITLKQQTCSQASGSNVCKSLTNVGGSEPGKSATSTISTTRRFKPKYEAIVVKSASVQAEFVDDEARMRVAAIRSMLQRADSITSGSENDCDSFRRDTTPSVKKW